MKYGVVVGTQRTGTTVLRSVLSTHPDISTFGEVFLNRHSQMKESFYGFYKRELEKNSELCIPSQENYEFLFAEYLKYLNSISCKSTGCVTLDVKYNFLMGALVPGESGVNRRPFLLHLFRKNDIKVIHLVRKDVLATYVSSLLSVQNQVWATEDLNRLKTRQVEVPLANLLELLRSRVEEQTYYSELLKDVALEITYEEMIVNGEFSMHVMKQVANRLGVKQQFDLTPKLKKIAPPKSESIKNFNEVSALLKGTEFEQYLSS